MYRVFFMTFIGIISWCISGSPKDLILHDIMYTYKYISLYNMNQY